ncbi:MAG: hypothetical protein AB7P99_05220 [Vicinamibacterales bacterium]
MKKPERHSQEWRDFQPVPEPEGSVERFKAALKRAEGRIRKKTAKPVPAQAHARS